MLRSPHLKIRPIAGGVDTIAGPTFDNTLKERYAAVGIICLSFQEHARQMVLSPMHIQYMLCRASQCPPKQCVAKMIDHLYRANT